MASRNGDGDANERQGHYTIPPNYTNLDELASPDIIERDQSSELRRHHTLEESRSNEPPTLPSTTPERRRSRRLSTSSRLSRRLSVNERPASEEYTTPANYQNLDEVAGPPPVENPDEASIYRHHSIEESRSPQSRRRRSTLSEIRELEAQHPIPEEPPKRKRAQKVASSFATQLYTISYLIFFSLLGTLARLGLQALTFYPGAPVDTGVLWANFGGSMVMGFLSEDRKLFWDELGDLQVEKEKDDSSEERNGRGVANREVENTADDPATIQALQSVKKTIPLYIGLATGFCGSFTSFSSFMRDVFLALSNDLPVPGTHVPPSSSTAPPISRNGGYSFMALLAVIILTTTSCLAALKFGAHFAIFISSIIPAISFASIRRFLDRLVILLAWGCWAGAIFMTIWPPDRSSSEQWRGDVLVALTLAPVGCLLRFYASLKLNGVLASFPLGTFAVNMFGTAILGLGYDLQRSSGGSSHSACQVLQGLEDGFCGTLTTVSTWVVELQGLRRRNAYRYGAASVVGGLSLLVVIIGPVRWGPGFDHKSC